MLGALTEDEGEPIKGYTVLTFFAGDEKLFELRHHRACGRAKSRGIGRHIAPAEDGQSFFVSDLRDRGDDFLGLGRICRQEGHSGGIKAGRWELEAAYRAEEGIGNSQQQTGAVAAVRFGSRCAPMFQVAECIKSPGDDVVTGLTGERGNKSDTTGVTLCGRVVETLGHGGGGERQQIGLHRSKGAGRHWPDWLNLAARCAFGSVARK
ncbi:hypothetical protein GALL_423540 [mine drainage metagenome]|uniref:Uncharacterized protein n=1 Tax=mine drainage metagenome TaxID=410659 RepID=A0A1J5PYG1_9ZZZZ